MSSPGKRLQVRLSPRGARLVLFAAAVFFMPVPFAMVVVGGLVPLVWIGVFALQAMITGLPKLTSEGFTMIGILLAHVFILGGILYVAAFVVSRVVFLLREPRIARLVIVALVGAMAVASFFEIYRLPGHNSAPAANIFGVIRALTG